MTIEEEFERSGTWLFRWRSYLPFPLMAGIALALLQLYFTPLDQGIRSVLTVTGMVLSFLGIAIRVYAVGHVPDGTSGRNARDGQVAEALNTTGIYSLVRNPLYVANLLNWLGVSVFVGVWWLPAYFIVIFWYVHKRIIFVEEKFLKETFGDDFLAWAKLTPAFFPRFKNWAKPDLAFSATQAMRRETSTVFLAVFTFFMLHELILLAETRELRFEWPWAVFMAAGIVVHLILRTLKRNTRVLHRERLEPAGDKSSL